MAIREREKKHTYIIAEAGVNHNGDIELARKLIDVAKEAGADAVKFQTFKAEESTSFCAEKAEYQKHTTAESESQLEMIRRLELPFSAFGELQKYCIDRDIDFISTPDGLDSLNCLLQLDVPLLKIGSTEVTNYPFLEALGKTGKPLILSTGMSTLGEIEKALEIIRSTGNQNITLMHCTTDYPTDINYVNLTAMKTMQQAFQVDVGYSDHTLGYEAAIAAVALGAECIEKHITLDRGLKGPDHQASMPPAEFKEYVTHIRNTECLLGDGRKRPTPNEIQNLNQVRRSIVTTRAICKGTMITKDMLCLKRPGTGIAPEYEDVLVGRTIKRDMEADEMIQWEDI